MNENNVGMRNASLQFDRSMARAMTLWRLQRLQALMAL